MKNTKYTLKIFLENYYPNHKLNKFQIDLLESFEKSLDEQYKLVSMVPREYGIRTVMDVWDNYIEYLIFQSSRINVIAEVDKESFKNTVGSKGIN